MPLQDPGNFAEQALAVTKSDSVVQPFRRLYVGGTGDVAVLTKGGNTTTFVAVPAGTYLDVAVTKVLSSGTSATNIVGLN